MRKILFFNYYDVPDPVRQSEIDRCLEENKKVFHVVMVFGRPNFNDLFNMSVPNAINWYCNSDIYFTDSVLSYKDPEPKECYALTRYNLINGEPVFFNRKDSQDAWGFNGRVTGVNAGFSQGLWGCDNRLAHEIRLAGYTVKNPSLSIKTIHLHQNDNRNYKRNKNNTVLPPYLTIEPHL